MKRKFSNFILLAAVAVICLLLLPTEAKAASAEDLTFTLNSDGESYTVSGCDTSASGELVIPCSHDYMPVTKIGYRAFNDCTSLTSITIPDSVTSIDDYTFYNCTGLTRITIPDSVTEIGYRAFNGCTSLTSITIPEIVASIGYRAFNGCTSLTGIWVDANNPNYCNDSYGVLFNKDKTELIQAPGAISGAYTIPDSVTSIGDYAFYNCTGLTRITIPDSVTSIDVSAFYNCSSLTSVIIPDSVTKISSSAFNGCTSLTGIWVDANNPNYCNDSYGVLFNKDKTELRRAAPGAISGAYTIPDSVTDIGELAFQKCTNLTSITIPDYVTTIGYGAFIDCTSLTSITIPESVTSIDASAFYNCSSLTSVIIPDSVTEIYSHTFYCCYNLTSVTIPRVRAIGDCAFEGCTKLTDVYYAGTQDAWDNYTSIGNSNTYLHRATLHLVDDCTAYGHTEETIPGKEATCTETGLTEGKKCSVCGEVITEQEEIKKLDHEYDESGKCACGAAIISVVDGKVIVNTNDLSGVKVHAFNITDKDVADITVWNELKATDPDFKTYTKSSFALKNGTYVLRVQYIDADGAIQAVSYEVTVDYTPAPVVGPEITVENNAVSVNNNGMTGVRVYAFNISDKDVADINVWNELKAADPSFKTYSKSSFTLKNGTYVLRVQYNDADGITHVESHKVTINYEIVIPQATVSGKAVTVDGNGNTVTKIHAFYVEGDEIADIDSWNNLKAADPSFKSYTKSQFAVKQSGAYVLRIEYVDQNGIAQKVSQLITA